jgi:TRAP-type C4-dicarboxylate transport system permease large subunit
MAAAYGIDPMHMGVIFLANMELGYLMPPGLHKFQCCIHPWMRAAIRVN